MIPGKRYKPEDFLEMAWRRRWVIVVPLMVFSLGAFGWANTLPNRYRATATVLVVPPRVPSTIIKSTITTRLRDRLQSLRARILSRTQLERIIQEFDLYREERNDMLPESVVEVMSHDVNLTVAKPATRRTDPSSFTISYDSANPKTAAQVTERLAAIFVNANLEDRELQTTSTTKFMQAQLDEARKRLRDAEQKIENFKRTYSGQLPSQVQSNVNVMQSTQSRLQQVAESINKDRDRLLLVQRQIADAETIVIAQHVPGGKSEEATNAPAAQRLEAARGALRNLELRGLKPEHPDVMRLKRTIRDLEVKADAEALQQPLDASGVTRAVSPAEATRMTNLTRLRTEAETIQRRIASAQEQEKRLQAMLGTYQTRLEAAPARESELAQLTRDQQTAQAAYAALEKKAEESQLAADVEERQIGEQFRLVDGARVPEKPFSPDRFKLTLYGLVIGLGLGIAVAGLLEYRDTSLRTEEDVLVTLSLPVVALVPTMRTQAERQRSRRRRILLASSAVASLLISAAAVVWKLRLFENLSR